MRDNELGRARMRAIVYDKCGSFDDLRGRDRETVIKDHEVLVHIRAAGLHVGDCFAVRGSPFVMRGGDRLPFR